MASNSLATLDNKRKRKLEVNDECAICEREKEDSAHALCRCPHARQLWQAMRQARNITLSMDNVHGSGSWLFDCLEQISEGDRTMFLMILWHIWFIRNEIMQGKSAPPIQVSVRFLESYASTLANQTTPGKPRKRETCGSVSCSACSGSSDHRMHTGRNQEVVG